MQFFSKALNLISPTRLPLAGLCLGATVALAAVGNSSHRPGGGHSAAPKAGEVTVLLDDTKTYQTIDNFSASDAWACQFVGLWPAAKKDAIADLLFSTAAGPGGQPKGIGLSMWRFNIGAGSAQQGEQSGIRDEWHRAESFLLPDGSYDWTRQAGQQWFLQAAKQRGVGKFLGFINSPPVQYTVTGKAFAAGGKTNIVPERYPDLATFLASVVQGVGRRTGITFDYLSPVNEPQWDWSDPKQEGSPFRNDEIAGVAKALNTALTTKQLPTKILIPEAGKITYLSGPDDKPSQGDQVKAFFNPASPTFVGSLPRMAPAVAGHSYFTTSPYAQAVATRQQLAAQVATVKGLSFWESEYCILGDNGGEINGGRRDLGMAPALYLARTIHTDLTAANAAAWQWWLAISPYDYKDGLIYIDKAKDDGQYYPSKMLWALGNYSRFVRPGAVRVEAQVGAAASNELLVSAYKNAGGKQLVVVVVNSGTAPASLRLALPKQKLGAVRPFTTSDTGDLQPGAVAKADQAVVVPPRSVTTLLSDLR